MRERAGGVFAALPDTLLSASLVRRPEADAVVHSVRREGVGVGSGVGAPRGRRALSDERLDA